MLSFPIVVPGLGDCRHRSGLRAVPRLRIGEQPGQLCNYGQQSESLKDDSFRLHLATKRPRTREGINEPDSPPQTSARRFRSPRSKGEAGDPYHRPHSRALPPARACALFFPWMDPEVPKRGRLHVLRFSTFRRFGVRPSLRSWSYTGTSPLHALYDTVFIVVSLLSLQSDILRYLFLTAGTSLALFKNWLRTSSVPISRQTHV